MADRHTGVYESGAPAAGAVRRSTFHGAASTQPSRRCAYCGDPMPPSRPPTRPGARSPAHYGRPAASHHQTPVGARRAAPRSTRHSMRTGATARSSAATPWHADGLSGRAPVDDIRTRVLASSHAVAATRPRVRRDRSRCGRPVGRLCDQPATQRAVWRFESGPRRILLCDQHAAELADHERLVVAS